MHLFLGMRPEACAHVQCAYPYVGALCDADTAKFLRETVLLTRSNLDAPGTTMPTFRAKEAATLSETYGYVLSYLDLGPSLTKGERHMLARLTLAAGFARLRSKKRLSCFVDAHILSAEIVGVFVRMKRNATGVV